MRFKPDRQRKAVMAKLNSNRSNYNFSNSTTVNTKKDVNIVRFNTEKVTTIPMREIEEKNRKAEKYWFSPDTLKFFKSRYGGTAYKKGNYAYFISSEKAPYGERKYTIRKANLKTGGIDTVGDFNKMTKSQADKKLKTILK